MPVFGTSELQRMSVFGAAQNSKECPFRMIDGLSLGELVLSFTYVSQLTKVLSLERLRLCQVVRDKKPSSINQLAKLLGRDTQSNIQKDVHESAALGIL